jgi:hypothetical protein
MNKELPRSSVISLPGEVCTGITAADVDHEKNDIGLTLNLLAEARHLPVPFLRENGLSDTKRNGIPTVRIPYLDTQNREMLVRFQVSLHGFRLFEQRQGDKPCPYGLWRLGEFHRHGSVALVLDEAECWTLWYHDIPALALDPQEGWFPEWAGYLQGLGVLLCVPDPKAELLKILAASIPDLQVGSFPEGITSFNAAFIQGRDVQSLLNDITQASISILELFEDHKSDELEGIRQQATPVLMAPDPLPLIKDAIRNLGYGGDLKPPLITYLAMTSRLLGMRSGAMPVHLLLVGPSSCGKSFTLQTVLRLFPEESYHKIDAGSPKVFIYEDADLQHRVAIFSEADSLPAGEDNPAASAMRNMMQDHHVRYKVTIKDPGTNRFTVQEICKPGPTVLITSAVRRLGPQLDTRLFSLDVPYDLEHIREALLTQARIEHDGFPEPDGSLIAYQSYLQALAPWEVKIPFVEKLAEELGNSAIATRVLRDFSRLLSLIKVVTILRHELRQRDEDGRWLAKVADYAAIYDLINEMYEVTITRAPKALHRVVQAVQELKDARMFPVMITTVAKHLGVSKQAVSRCVAVALKEGWLVNLETRKGYPFNLDIGEPLPEGCGLPLPQLLETLCEAEGEPQQEPETGASTPETQELTPQLTVITNESSECQPVQPLTGRNRWDEDYDAGSPPVRVSWEDDHPPKAASRWDIARVICKHCISFLSGTKDGRCINRSSWNFGPLSIPEAETPRPCSYFERKPGAMDG